jgi:hypothetical protein
VIRVLGIELHADSGIRISRRYSALKEESTRLGALTDDNLIEAYSFNAKEIMNGEPLRELFLK